MLSCNPTKTEIAHFMSQFKQYDPIPGIFINGIIIPPVPAARNLGTILDSHLKLNAHVNNICKKAHYAIRSIGRIQKYLSQEDCEKLIHAFVTSRLDSCNSTLYGLPEYSLSPNYKGSTTPLPDLSPKPRNPTILYLSSLLSTGFP